MGNTLLNSNSRGTRHFQGNFESKIKENIFKFFFGFHFTRIIKSINLLYKNKFYYGMFENTCRPITELTVLFLEEGVPGSGHQPPGLHPGHRGGWEIPVVQSPSRRPDKRKSRRHLGN